MKTRRTAQEPSTMREIESIRSSRILCYVEERFRGLFCPILLGDESFFVREDGLTFCPTHLRFPSGREYLVIEYADSPSIAEHARGTMEDGDLVSLADNTPEEVVQELLEEIKAAAVEADWPQRLAEMLDWERSQRCESEALVMKETRTAQDLVFLAAEMLDRAYCPYSRFPVGAALECADGTVFTGCNVESAAYGSTICAERTALVKAISEGRRDFVRLAVVGNSSDYCAPCGACRQLLYEFAPDLEVIVANGTREFVTRSLRELLPMGFGAEIIER